MRTFHTIAIASLLLAEGCIGPESDGLGPWTECDDLSDRGAVVGGRQGDACDFSEGSLCQRNDADRTHASLAMCLGHVLIRTDVTRIGSVPAERCQDGPNVIVVADEGWDLRPAADGCLNGATCGRWAGSAPGVYLLCPAASETPPEPDADLSPWTDCDAIIDRGLDGDPCRGQLLCSGERPLGPSSSSNTLVGWCDVDVLRLYAIPRSF